jgi:hypothetical protein
LTPEEEVRQQVLYELIEKGYPKSCLAVEKGIKEISAREFYKKPPLRRIDIACFGKVQGDELQPLLVIECKSVQLTTKMIRQVLGYNIFIKAPIVALINQTSTCILPAISQSATMDVPSMNHLPSYQELIHAARLLIGII